MNSPSAKMKVPLIVSDVEVRRLLTSRDWSPRLEGNPEMIKGSPFPVLLMLTGEEHEEHRRRADTWFLPSVVSKWTETIRARCESVVESLHGPEVELSSAFARPVSMELACAFVGLRIYSWESVMDAALPFTSDDLDVVRRRDRASLRIYRMLLEETAGIAQDLEDSEGDLLSDSRGHEQDVLAASLALLTSGWEGTARALLACIVGCLQLRTQGSQEGKILKNRQIDQLLSTSGLRERVSRQRYRAGEIEYLDASLSPLDPAGKVCWMPFGFGQHFCLGAGWVREICRVGASVFCDAFPEARILDSRSADEGSGFFGGTVSVRVALC